MKSFLEKQNPIICHTQMKPFERTNVLGHHKIVFTEEKSHKCCESWNTFQTSEFSYQRMQMTQTCDKGCLWHEAHTYCASDDIY